MENQNPNIEQLVSQIAAKNKRTFRLSLLISILFLILGTIWLIYSFRTVSSLRSEADGLNKEIQEKNAELGNKNKELQDATDTLLALNPMLKKYGLLKKITKNDLNSAVVLQSLEANAEILQTSSSEDQRRKALTILYFLKDADSGKVGEALKELGFNLKVASPIAPHLPTNLIGFGKNVMPEDAKLVAYVLMRAGVEIKGICKSSNPSYTSTIQVLGAASLLSSPALKTQQVKDQTEFHLCGEM